MWGSKTKELQKYGTDITMLAQLGKMDSVIGREEEIEVLIEALMKKRNSNACLVGGAGVGKTAIVEALATKIVGHSVPDKLIGKKVISIDMNCIVDGAVNREESEKRVKDVLDEVRDSEGGVILFLDNLHNFIKDDGIASILKLALARDDFKCIGATRVDEYRKYIERDGALKDMFETIQVCEPSREDNIEILKDIFHEYEDHHRVKYTQTALVSAVDLSNRYIRELFLPRKAINLIDKAGARAKVLGFEYVTEVEIEHVVSKSIGVRLSQTFTKEEAASLFQLEDVLKLNLIGQDKAVSAVCGSIRRARVEMRGETKPIGCFLFVGPTGVGKTEMAKVLAKEYFGSEAAVVRLDTRRFMEGHIVSQLVSQMVEEVRQRPHCLVLFDEIEKAHEEALNVVLQIINDGRLSDGEGKVVEFRDTIVVVISNAESHSYKAEVVNGFDQVVLFKPLEKEHVEKILEITIEEFVARVLERNRARVEVSERLKKWLLLIGYDKRYGARALKRAFATSVETKLADEVLSGRVAQGDTVKLDVSVTGDVECHISRVKINHQTSQHSDGQLLLTKTVAANPNSIARTLYSDSDYQLLITRSIISRDAKGRRHTKRTIGGVDAELILPLLHKHRLQHPLKKGYRGLSVQGVEADVVIRIVKSFL